VPHVVWVYASVDPVASGELRRLLLPALAGEGETWTSEVVCKATTGSIASADVAVVALDALEILPLLARTSAAIIVEIDAAGLAGAPGTLDALAAASNRIAGAVARDPHTAARTQKLLGDSIPVWLIRDCAARDVELAAAARRFGIGFKEAEPLDLPENFELWFAEPGDLVESAEIAAVVREWRPGEGRGIVIAPPEIHAWLAQSGVDARCHDWSPARLAMAVRAAERCVFPGPLTFSHQRRVSTARRIGGGVTTEIAFSPSACDPGTVADAWRQVLRLAAGPRPSGADAGVVLVLLDLVQDLDLALPLIDELAAARDIGLRVIVSKWLHRRSPRVAAELSARDLVVETCERAELVSGAAPSLDGVGAVVAIVESSLSAHQQAHAMIHRARAAAIPTFSLQHGVENVGLVHMDFETSEPPTLASDHLFVWFGPGQVPESVPAALRPRLVHAGRPAMQPVSVVDLRATLAAFEDIIAVFENLHWSRYDGGWRRQFLSDCVAFAVANPRRAVILKPHHAGLWSVRNNHLLPDWPPNLILADPTDPFWEPLTAASLLQVAELVFTTPSTVALDAVQAGKPVAIAAYGLELPAYAPLSLLQSFEDWSAFANQKDSVAEAKRRADFLCRTVSGENAARTMAACIIAAARERAEFRNRNQAREQDP